MKLVFGLSDELLAGVILYLKIVSPVVLFNGIRHFLTGLLVQSKHTLTVTFLNVVYLVSVLLVLVTGFQLGWQPIVTVAISQVVSALTHMSLSAAAVRWKYRLPEETRHENLTYRESFTFFWPVALTSVMFAFTRPVIYSFVSRLPDPEPVLAALRVSFDMCLIFFNPINQFRHLYVTFGLEDPAGVRRFMIKVMVVLTVVMLLVAGTPLSSLIFHHMLGLEGEVLRMAVQVVWVLTLVPLTMTLRNYFHGLSLVHRRTGRMGLGGVLRVVTTFLACLIFFQLGWFNHVTAAFMLVIGFLVEALTVMLYSMYSPAARAPREDRNPSGV